MNNSLIPLLGGRENIEEIDNCYSSKTSCWDSALVKWCWNQKMVPGILKPSKTAVQVIIGPHVEFIATGNEKST